MRISATTKNTNKVVSILEPVLKCQLLDFLMGQKGFIPSNVKESANKCKEYPRKKGKARIGIKAAKNTETIMHNVKE